MSLRARLTAKTLRFDIHLLKEEEAKQREAAARLALLQKDDHHAGTASQGKRRKLGDGGPAIDDSDSDSDDAGGDLAADGDWEEFDAMPAQTVDVRCACPFRD